MSLAGKMELSVALASGYIPLLFTQTTCIIDDDTGEYEWDVEEALFACVPPLPWFSPLKDSFTTMG